MLKAWASLRAGAEVSDVRAWLHRIVHNAALDALANRRGDEAQLTEAVGEGVPTQERAIQRFEVRRALAAVAGLPGTQRRAITLTAIEGRSGREAARTLGVSEGALRMMVHRARSHLRAAAGALVPVPLRGWLANLLESPAVSRLAEARCGAGLAAAATQAVALVGITGATVTGTSLLSHSHPRTPARPSPAAPVRDPTVTPGRIGAAVAPSGRRVRLALPAGAAPDRAPRFDGRADRAGGPRDSGSRRPDRSGGSDGDGPPTRTGTAGYGQRSRPAGSAPAARSADARDAGGAIATATSSTSSPAGPTGDLHARAPEGGAA